MTPSSPTATVLKTERATIEGIQQMMASMCSGDCATMLASAGELAAECIADFGQAESPRLGLPYPSCPAACAQLARAVQHNVTHCPMFNATIAGALHSLGPLPFDVFEQACGAAELCGGELATLEEHVAGCFDALPTSLIPPRARAGL